MSGEEGRCVAGAAGSLEVAVIVSLAELTRRYEARFDAVRRELQNTHLGRLVETEDGFEVVVTLCGIRHSAWYIVHDAKPTDNDCTACAAAWVKGV